MEPGPTLCKKRTDSYMLYFDIHTQLDTKVNDKLISENNLKIIQIISVKIGIEEFYINLYK